MEESIKYHIPEEIPANERTAFHGAAAAAAKAGKKNFNFGGKTHPVTMKKDTATKIADQKESTMTFREKLISVLEGDRKAHYKGATEPETMDDKLKGKGAKDMAKPAKDAISAKPTIDEPEIVKKDMAKMTANVKKSPMRKNDNAKGDSTIIAPGTPMKDPAKMQKESNMQKESFTQHPMNGKTMKDLLDAIKVVEDLDKVHTVDIDHMTGKAGEFEKKHNITLKKKKIGTDATGKKRDLQKYLKKHYDGDHKTMHPEIYKESTGEVTERKRTISTKKVKGDRSMHDQHAKTGYGMGGEQTYAAANNMKQTHYSKYISKKSGHESYFDGKDLVHAKSSKTVVSNALHGKHTPDQLADKMKAHGDKHKG